MSMRTLFERASRWLLAVPRGAKITDKDGKRKDTGVQSYAEDEVAMFRAEGPIPLYKPLVFYNYTDGNAIEIVNKGPTDQTGGVGVSDEAGQGSQLGIGLGSKNINAASYTPFLPANIDPLKVHLTQSQGQTVRYGDLERLGLDRPPASEAKADDKVDPGFEFRNGQPYAPGVVQQGAVNYAPSLSVNQFFQSWNKVNNTTWSFVWNNNKYYVTTSDALANGVSDTLTVVSDVTCNAGVLSVTHEEWTFENGILIDVA